MIYHLSFMGYILRQKLAKSRFKGMDLGSCKDGSNFSIACLMGELAIFIVGLGQIHMGVSRDMELIGDYAYHAAGRFQVINPIFWP